uniref:ShKT domain-containing protein n=1 Tax=Panagrolaimus davidi TaxID=227884 RepID=A0A914PDS4_9BILA
MYQLLFLRSQSTQTSQQQPSRFFQQQLTTRFVPVTTTVASTTPLSSTRSHSTTPAVESSRFSNPQRTTTFQQSISSAVNQQTSSQILSSSPPTTKSTASSAAVIGITNLPSTTTTPTVFIQPIEQTTPRRPFGRFVLSEAKAIDLKDLRNRTGILGKIIKQQKIFDELIRDTTLTTRNLPFTTPGEDKLIVDKRLQKLDETVKRFRTATPPFGFQLVSSIPTKRSTRSTTQFLSTQLLGRNAVTAQGVVDRDLANPSRTTSTPSTTTTDRFRKFERILPKRILGNDFRQIVFPTTTSTRSTRSTTTNNSNLLIVDGQAFGDHFVFNSLPQPNLQDVIFGKVPTISSSSTSLSPVTIPLSSAKPLLPLKERNRQLKRKIFFFRNRHSGEMVIAPQDDECVDGDTACDFWAKNGECKANPVYMLTVCRLSCHICIPFYS